MLEKVTSCGIILCCQTPSKNNTPSLILNRKPPGHEHETGKKELFNKKDKDGYTPLDHVYRRKFSDESNINRRDLILLLKSHGCKSNFYDKNGVWVGKSNGDLN